MNPHTKSLAGSWILMPEQKNTAQNLEFTNTNRWDTRQLVVMALLCAIGVLLSFFEPAVPGYTWLKYDPSAMPAMVCGFAFGPGAGLAVGIVGAVIHGILFGDFFGAIMTILVVCGFVLPASLVYRKIHTMKGAALGLVLSVIISTATAILGNLIVTPLFGTPLNAVFELILPVLVPFNLIKAVLNSLLTLVVYKIISNLITPKKKRVRGR